MKGNAFVRGPVNRSAVQLLSSLLLVGVFALSACAPKDMMRDSGMSTLQPVSAIQAPSPDPRVGLGAGLFDAEEAIWNLSVLSQTRPSEAFVGITNSDLAFTGNYAIQGNYNGVQVFDISNPRAPVLVTEYVCPASQSDVSVYGDLMFVSGEGTSGRLDCGDQGVEEAVSEERLRGIRIFNISDIRNPEYISNVQTCRGSHTHSVLKDPNDDDNVYIYVSGSSSVRPEAELAGCSGLAPSDDPNSALFRIEVIKVPLAHPEQAAIVSSPRIFNDLVAPPVHGESPADIVAREEAIASGAYVGVFRGRERVLSQRMITPMLEAFMEGRGGGEATKADTDAFRAALPGILEERFPPRPQQTGPRPGPTQCHDITLYPAIGRAGGACGGYGLLLDITDPANPVRMDAVADSNFSYWHSATFSNDGSKMLFTDEWGGGGGPKCRETDPKEWGANAYFDLKDGRMEFKSYWKLPAPQTSFENCVAHNGSLIPIPDREVMVQSWYQGGISVVDWTDISNPIEIAFHDRGPSDGTRMGAGGSWSVYWYNGALVSSEISRGLDIFQLEPSAAMTANEIAAANSVHLDYLNAQGQPQYTWPNTFALAGAYLDQLERSRGLESGQITSARAALESGSRASGAARRAAMSKLAGELHETADSQRDSGKVHKLAGVVDGLAAMQ
ncbi:MAG: hypothetical protein ACI84D_001670 [Thalassolituus oleivorans]|jgi:hypothetical protein